MPNKKALFLVVFLLILATVPALISVGISIWGPKCTSDREVLPGNFITGKQQSVGTEATLCIDRAGYSKGDVVRLTFTVVNKYYEPVELGGGQQPVMDLCAHTFLKPYCLSQVQPEKAGPTHLVLQPGQSHTIAWEWKPSNKEEDEQIIRMMNNVTIVANWIGADGGPGTVFAQFNYGPQMMGP
jgi:hypothetical protein